MVRNKNKSVKDVYSRFKPGAYAMLICIILIPTGLAFALQSRGAQFTVANIQELKIALSKVKPGDVIIWKNGE